MGVYVGLRGRIRGTVLILPEEEVMMTLKTFALVLLFFVDIFSLIKYESSISRLIVLRQDISIKYSSLPQYYQTQMLSKLYINSAQIRPKNHKNCSN